MWLDAKVNKPFVPEGEDFSDRVIGQLISGGEVVCQWDAVAKEWCINSTKETVEEWGITDYMEYSAPPKRSYEYESSAKPLCEPYYDRWTDEENVIRRVRLWSEIR